MHSMGLASSVCIWVEARRPEELIRDRIRPCDMLVISIGGNDIALAPSIFTVIAMVLLILERV